MRGVQYNSSIELKLLVYESTDCKFELMGQNESSKKGIPNSNQRELE